MLRNCPSLPQPSYQVVLCGLFSQLVLGFMDTQNTFLKLSVMGRHEPWAGFLLKYSLGCLYLFISCPLPGGREEKNKHYNSTFGSNSVETKIFISVIKCVNTVAVFNVISLLYTSIRLNGRNQCA